MDKKLKQFVEQSWEKIKKSKKSPKNFGVERYAQDYRLIKSEQGSQCIGVYEGNLDNLYQNRNTTKQIVKKVNVTTTKTPIRKISFNTNWVSPLAILLKAADFDKMTYNGNIKGVSKEQFTSIQNWVKLN